MAVKGLKDLLATGRDILWTGLQGPYKILMAQIGDAASSVPGELVEIWQHIGFVSRPPKPREDGNNTQCAQGVTINDGHYPICIATRDARYNDILGDLKDGETCIYAAGEHGEAQGRALFKQNGSINLYTAANAGATGMGIFINPADNSISILNADGAGIIIKDKTVSITTGDASLELDGSKASLTATGMCTVDGSTVCLGANPAMVPGVNSVCAGPTGLVSVASTKVLVALA